MGKKKWKNYLGLGRVKGLCQEPVGFGVRQTGNERFRVSKNGRKMGTTSLPRV